MLKLVVRTYNDNCALKGLGSLTYFHVISGACCLFSSVKVHRWEDNIKMELQEVGRGCGDWMEMAQDRDM